MNCRTRAAHQTHPAPRPALLDVLEHRTLFSATTPAVVGYLPDYRVSNALMATLSNARFEGLTQVNYFSVDPTPSGLLPGTTVGTASNPSTLSSGGYGLSGSSSQLATLVTAAHADGVKVVVTIGGGGSQSNTLTNVVEAGAATWQTFAASVQQFATAHGIDGVDLDWEPASLGSSDQADYGGLIATLKTNTTGLTLSAAVNSERLQVAGGGSAYVLNATGVQDLTSINVMAYDLQAGNVSPIGQAESDLSGWENYVTASGGNKHELIFASPFYGTSGTSWANTVAATYGQLVSENGALPDPSLDKVVINGTTWNYNGPATIDAKAAFALDTGAGGVAAWELGQDYFTPAGGYDPTHSLLPQYGKALAANTGTITGAVTGTNGAAVTVYLDSNNNTQPDPGEPTTTTNAAGGYTFADLLPGSYTVREVVPGGYTQTAPAAGVAVAPTPGGTAVANFTLAAAAAPLVLTGSVNYLKLDADGLRVDVWSNVAATGTPAQQVTLSQVTSISDTAGSLTVDFSAGDPLPSSGLTYDGGAVNTLAIVAGTGTATVGSSTVTVAGAFGSATISYAHAAALTVTGGTALTQSAQPGATLAWLGTANADTLDVAAGTFTVAAGSGNTDYPLGTLTVAAGSTFALATAPAVTTVLDVTHLSLAGTLDLGGNAMILRSATVATLTPLLAAAYANGTWAGPGLTSSLAAADPAHLTAVGAIPAGAATAFAGQPVTAADVLVRCTVYGDANLDGTINAADYSRLDAGFVAHLTGWASGDFNYDGTVDGSDYTLIDNAFNHQAPAAAPTAVTAEVAAPAAVRATPLLVPALRTVPVVRPAVARFVSPTAAIPPSLPWWTAAQPWSADGVVDDLTRRSSGRRGEGAAL